MKIGNAFTNAYNVEMEASKKEKKDAPDSTDDNAETIPGVSNMSFENTNYFFVLELLISVVKYW